MQELRKHWLEHLQCCNEIVTYQILETEGAAVRHTALHHRDALLGALTV